MPNEFHRKLLDEVGANSYIATFAERGREIAYIDNYTYTIDGNTLPANITATAPQAFNVIMDSDCDFVLTYYSGMGRVLGATSLILNPAMLIQIKDQSSGRTYFNTPAPMPMLCGIGGFPFLLASPRVIKPRTTLTVTAISAQIQSFSGFYMCLHGSRIYYAN